MNILVSIIIPTYNRLESLFVTIASIKRQSCQSYEVIVIDDAGNDGTPEALAGIDHVCVLVNETRQGPSCGRNRAISKACGEYVWFLDSDVALPDEHLIERMIATFKSDPDIGSLGGEIVVHELQTDQAYGRNVCWNAHNVRVTSFAGKENLVPCDYLATCNCFTSREFAQQIEGFDQRFVFGAEDMDFGVRLLALGKQNYVRHDLAVLHYHEKKGRYLDETVRYQTTRVIFARKHYNRIRFISMMMIDAVSVVVFYLLLVPKLFMMIATDRTINSQNLIGGWNTVAPYFARKTG